MSLKRKIKANSKDINGIWRVIPSPYITEIISNAGFDFQILDCEHGAYDYDTLYKDILACELHRCSPIIRVGGLNAVEVQRCLDFGVEGIIFPQLATYQDFKNAVELTKYAPLGVRGFNPFVRAGGFGVGDSPNKIQPYCITIIETLSAVEQMEKILSLEGIDMIYIGAYDLSAQLGLIGKMDSPELLSVIDHIITLCQKFNKPISLMVHNSQQKEFYQKRQVKVFVHSTDSYKIASHFSTII